MVFDNKSDKQMILHVIDNFQLQGPYTKVAQAISELAALRLRVDQAAVKLPSGAVKHSTALKEVK